MHLAISGMEQNPYANAPYCISLPETESSWLKSLHEVDLVNIGSTNKVLHHAYPRLIHAKRETRVDELNKKNGILKISLDENNFKELPLAKNLTLQDIPSVLILMNYAIAPLHKPYFVAPLIINNDHFGLLVTCNYDDYGPVNFKRKRKKCFIKPIYCINPSRDSLIISSYECSLPDNNRAIHYITPQLQHKVMLFNEEKIDTEIIGYNQGFVIGTFPREVFLSCNEHDVITANKNKYYTDIFGQEFKISESLSINFPNVCQHIFNNTTAKETGKLQLSVSCKNKKPMIASTTYYKLMKKPDDFTWQPEVVSALNAFTKFKKGSFGMLCEKDYANMVIALVLEEKDNNRNTNKKYASILHYMINQKVWAPIQDTHREINAINIERWKIGETYLEKKRDRGEHYDFMHFILPSLCESVIPKDLLTTQTVSFSDETKITPDKLVALIQNKAEENARNAPAHNPLAEDDNNISTNTSTCTLL
jgi:hypothetical protein